MPSRISRMFNRIGTPFVAGGNSSCGGAASQPEQQRAGRNNASSGSSVGQNLPPRRGDGTNRNTVPSGFYTRNNVPTLGTNHPAGNNPTFGFYLGNNQPDGRPSVSGSSNAPIAASTTARPLSASFSHSPSAPLEVQPSLTRIVETRAMDGLANIDDKEKAIRRLNEQFNHSIAFAKAFGGLIEAEKITIAGKTTLSEADRKKANAKLEKIKAHLDRFITPGKNKKGAEKSSHETGVGGTLVNDGGHTAARNCFKEITKICENGAAYFSDKEYLPDFFSSMGDLCNNLKQHHFSYSADPLTEHFAETMAYNIGLTNPGLKNQRPGSEIRRTTEVGVSVKTDFMHKILSVGPILNLSCACVDWLYVDDDGDTINQEWRNWSASAGVQAKVLDLDENCNSSKSLLSFSALVKWTKTRGNYADHKSLAKTVKYKFRGIQDYWSYINRSGTKSSMGNRMVAVMQVPRKAAMWIAAGPGYKNPGRVPNFKQKKLNKGAFNQEKIQELGDALLANRGQAGLDMLTALKEAYKTPAQELEETLFRKVPERKPFDAPYNPTLENCPLPTPGPHLPMKAFSSLFRNTKSIEVTAQFFGPELCDAAGFKINVGAKASLRGEVSQNRAYFMKFIPPHRQIDPFASCDAERSHVLLHQFQTLYANRPEAHLMGVIKGSLDARNPDGGLSPMSDTSRRLRSELGAIDNLSRCYSDLVKLSSKHRSLQDSKLTGKAASDKRKMFEDELTKFSQDLFGIESGQREGFLNKLKKDPEYFMIRAYDAISIALGQVGTHVYDTKIHSPIRHSDAPLSTQFCNSLRSLVEQKYANLTEAMDGVSLPINQETLFRGVSIIPPGRSVNETYSLTADLRGGGYSSLLKYINNGGNQQGQYLTPAFAIGGGLQLFRRNHWDHPNPVRTGCHEQAKIVIEGDGFMAPAVARLFDVAQMLHHGAKRFVGFSEHAKERKFSTGMFHEVGASITATAAAAHTKKKELSVGTRKPNPVGQFTYQQNVQWFRVASTSSNTVTASGPVPLHASGVPVTVTPSFQMTDSSSNVTFEALGKDVGYHLIQTEALFKVTKACGWHSDKRPSERGTLDFENFRAYFLPTADKPAPQEVVDGEFMMNKYFASSESVFGVLEDWIAYHENRRDLNGGPNMKATIRNEFHRFDDDPATWSAIKSMDRSKAGSGIAQAKDYTQNELDTARAGNLDARPIPEKMHELLAAMKEMKARICNKKLTAKERMELFVGGRPGSPGQTIFKAYLEIMRGYNEINTAVKATTTYQSLVVAPPDLPQ